MFGFKEPEKPTVYSSRPTKLVSMSKLVRFDSQELYHLINSLAQSKIGLGETNPALSKYYTSLIDKLSYLQKTMENVTVDREE